MPAYSAIIAAAGLSQRNGFPKALREFAGEPAAYFLARTLWQAHIQQIYVSLPPVLFERTALLAHLRSIDSHPIANRLFHDGYAGSIVSAMDFITECNGIFITPIDTIFSKNTIIIMKIVASAYLDHPTIIVPHCHLNYGHPVYLSWHFSSALKKCERYGGLHRIIERYPNNVLKLTSFDRRVLFNLNDQKALSLALS